MRHSSGRHKKDSFKIPMQLLQISFNFQAINTKIRLNFQAIITTSLPNFRAIISKFLLDFQDFI
jgi:hypothetical protein